MPPKPTTPKKTKKQLEEEKKRLEERKKVIDEALELLFHRICNDWLVEEELPSIAAQLVEEFKPVLVDPLTEIGRMDPRHVKELHLGSRNMTDIHENMCKFEMLEELWLNHNRLKIVTNLMDVSTLKSSSRELPLTKKSKKRGCLRLKYLYLQQNRIESLDDQCMKNLKFLEVLLLHDNKLKNLDLVLQQLSHMKYLKQLTLFGNPLCEEAGSKSMYRGRVITALRSLVVFDRIEITETEREEVTKLFPNRIERLSMSREEKLAFGKTLPANALESRKANTMSASILGGTAELAIHEAKQIVKENSIYKRKLEEEERAMMAKTLKESIVKQYKAMEENENQKPDNLFERLSHVYRDFDGLLTADQQQVMKEKIIKAYHPAFLVASPTLKPTIPPDTMNELLRDLGISQFAESWIQEVESKKGQETFFVTEDEKKKISLYKDLTRSSKEVSFHDFFLLICELKSEEEFLNSHNLQKQLDIRKVQFEKKKKERIEREEKEQQVQQPRPKSGGGKSKTSQPPRKITDNTEEEEIECQQLEEMSKNTATLELQAASKAIKWQSKSQLHETMRPKEIKIVPKRGDVYKSYYL
ncbi:hypothetical protein FDP41_012030 [Naegleria fowleri]|uniref:U2A'/phosphoprotein 32 family A C-terminal domain-containing protein n=1 Tax=Naegleria fowleri TaxID=5763 RepID=A0A6A5CA73_NAEFO|nr:uncharacterized protein FDP41_012030 [Naegleria fowleri]KAF0982169.1 hypothetical protein FDP41_012030 [Naegleria fowleri]CAG4712963.1 unnamed protein product [Naegleria fowleri]